MSSARYSTRNRTRSPRWGRERSVRYRDDRVRRRYRDGDGEPRHPEKVRKLTVTARECLVEVDYLEQSVLIHRDSYPEYLTDDGQSRYRHESVVERPRVDTGEPLRNELESFVEAVRTGTEPEVTAEDGIQALETVQLIDRLAMGATDETDDEPPQEPEVEA